MFFRLSSLELGLIIFGVIAGTTLLGTSERHKEGLREPFGVLQAALLGLVGLILAFGLTLAVGRYEQRRAAVVDEANAIGTTYLRAQALAEPARGLIRVPDAPLVSVRMSMALPPAATGPSHP